MRSPNLSSIFKYCKLVEEKLQVVNRPRGGGGGGLVAGVPCRRDPGLTILDEQKKCFCICGRAKTEDFPQKRAVKRFTQMFCITFTVFSEQILHTIVTCNLCLISHRFILVTISSVLI
jgi:hypothetical protein